MTHHSAPGACGWRKTCAQAGIPDSWLNGGHGEPAQSVAQSPYSMRAQLLLGLDRQSGVGAESQQTPTGTSLLCSGLICYPRGSWSRRRLWPTLHAVHTKRQHVVGSDFPPGASFHPHCFTPTLPPRCSPLAASLDDQV